MPAVRKFAAGTAVTANRSLLQIRQTLLRFGATAFAQAEDADRISIMFVIAGADGTDRRIRYTIALPAGDSLMPKSRRGYAGWSDADIVAARRVDEIDRLWRALATGIKGKLVLVESGIESAEEAFYANVVLPETGETLYEATARQIAEGYRTGRIPPLLPGIPVRTFQIDGGR